MGSSLSIENVMYVEYQPQNGNRERESQKQKKQSFLFYTHGLCLLLSVCLRKFLLLQLRLELALLLELLGILGGEWQLKQSWGLKHLLRVRL